MGINNLLEKHEMAEEGRYQRSMEEKHKANHYLARSAFLEDIEKDLRMILGKFERAEDKGLIESDKAKEIRNLIEKAYGVF